MPPDVGERLPSIPCTCSRLLLRQKKKKRNSPLRESLAGVYRRLCEAVTVPDLLGTGSRCKVEPASMPDHLT